jgi:hypothetical protein
MVVKGGRESNKSKMEVGREIASKDKVDLSYEPPGAFPAPAMLFNGRW